MTLPFESDVRSLVQLDVEHREQPLPFLLLGTGDQPGLMVGAREHERHGETDRMSELVLSVTACRPDVAALVVPSRFRDLATDEVLDRQVVVTSAHRSDGPVRIRVDAIPYRLGPGVRLGSTMPLEVSRSPVASLLYDACTTSTALDMTGTLAVLTVWGHAVMTRSGTVDDPAVAPPSSRASYAAGRLAREFRRRHHPTAEGGDPPARPAVPTDLPTGFVPACPI